MDAPLPQNEQIIRYTDAATNTQCYYGFDLTVSQSDVPYILVSGAPRLASQTHFSICADTVRISESLVNPGRDIRVTARQVIFAIGAKLDTSGADPVDDFTAGQVPQQDQTAGAAGTPGAAGAQGTPAGAIVVTAESIIYEGETPVQGATAMIPLVPALALEPLRLALANNALSSTVPASSPVALPGFSAGWSEPGMVGAATFTGVEVGGGVAAVGQILSATPTAETGFAIGFTLTGLNFSATLAVLELSSNFAGTMSAPGAQLSVTAAISCDPDQLTSRLAQLSVTLSGFAPTYSLTGADAGLVGFAQSGLAREVGQIQQELQTALQAAVSEVITAALSRQTTQAGGVMLTAMGGRGGRGQDGHAGVGGAHGIDGEAHPGAFDWSTAYFPTPMPSAPPDTIGGPGGHGGVGGPAGRSGDGAPGGSVSVNYVLAAPSWMAVDVSGGNGGAAATPGLGGAGGAGGNAGSYTVQPVNKYGLNSGDPIYLPGRAGTKGPDGPDAQPSIAGLAGPLGTVQVNHDPVYHPLTYADLTASFPLAQLLITQRVASLLFLDKDADPANNLRRSVQLFHWLANVTEPLLNLRVASDWGAWTPADIAVGQQMNAFAKAQLCHFQTGLDFYGHPSNWVSLLSLATYVSDVSSLLSYGQIVQDQFNEYQTTAKDEAATLAQLTATAANLNSTLAQLDAQLTATGTAISVAQTSIDAQTDRLTQQRTVISADETAFMQEFQKYEMSCSFSQLLSAVEKIVTLGAGVASGMGEIQGALEAEDGIVGKDLLKGVKDSIGAIQPVMAAVNDVQATIDAIQTGVNAINTALPPGANPDQQVGLLVTDQQNFDAFIAKFLADFPTSAQLKQDVDDYFAMIKARNQTIITYNGLYVTQARLQAQRDQYNRQLEALAPQIASAQPDPTLPGNQAFMQSALSALKETIVARLYEENRAYWYWSLEAVPFSTSDLTIATLAATQATLQDKIQTLQTLRANIQQKFTQTLTVTAADFPTAFANLAASTAPNRRLSFALSHEDFDFDNPYRALVDSFTLSFPDLSAADGPAGKASFNVYLIHPGVGYQLDLEPDPQNPKQNVPTRVEFCHVPIENVTYTVDLSTPTNSGGGGFADAGSLGVCPFAQWTLSFEYPYDTPAKDWLTPTVLAKIKSVVITFTGTFISPKSPGA